MIFTNTHENLSERAFVWQTEKKVKRAALTADDEHTSSFNQMKCLEETQRGIFMRFPM